MLFGSLSVPRFISLVGIGVLIATAARGAELRTWTDSTGKYTLQAKFISVEGGEVNLVRENGEKMTIALDKLSKADREYIAKLKADSPFKKAKNSPFKPAQRGRPMPGPAGRPSRAPDADVDEVAVDWSESEIVLLDASGSGWKVAPPAADASGFAAKSVALPQRRDFFEKIAGVAINPVAKKAVVGYILKRPGGDGPSTRIVMCDLERGRNAATATTPGEMKPLALADDGQRILMCRNEFGHGKSNRLEIWSIEGKEVVRSLSWTPYDDNWRSNRDVTWAEFVDADTLATCSAGGKVALWNAATAKPICHFQLSTGALPALSADRKWIAFVDKERVGLFDVRKREVVAVQRTPIELSRPMAAISPSGRKIGCVAQDRILVWDTASGELQQNFKTSGIAIFTAVDFPDDEFILAGKQYLIDLDTQIKLWHYEGAEYFRTVGGTTFVAVSVHNGPGVLAKVEVPHEEALALLEKATKQKELFAFHKGTPVKLNVSAIPDPHGKSVEEALTKKLKQMGCPIQADAAVELVASVEGPKKKKVRYMHSGEYKVKEYRTRLTFMYQGKPIWEGSGRNIPFILRLEAGENVEGVLRKASKQPAYSYYDRVTLPEFLQKPSADSKHPDSGQTLGECRVTATGFH